MPKTNLIILKRVISLSLAIIFAFSGMAYPTDLSALPVAGTLLMASPRFEPVTIKGLKIYPDDPLRLDFILDQSDTAESGVALREHGRQMIRYFLACLTVPAKDLWVNLSPYEPERITPNEFGLTEMGQNLLAQDYVLKQLAASLTYPESNSGKAYWNEIDTPVGGSSPTAASALAHQSLTKVWIVPDKAIVCEENNTALIKEARLKVLTEEDYLAAQKNPTHPISSLSKRKNDPVAAFRQHILPLIEKDVNEGAHFAQLRQAYHALVLAIWFKKKMRATFFNQCYLDQKKIAGVKGNDPALKEKLYQKYLEAFQKGAYNYVKREPIETRFIASVSKITRRQYFSGGVGLGEAENLEQTEQGLTAARKGLSNPSTMAVALTPAKPSHSESLKAKGKFYAEQGEKVIGSETLTVNSQTPKETARMAKRLLATRDPLGQPLAEELPIIVRRKNPKTTLSAVVDREFALTQEKLETHITEVTAETHADVGKMPRQLVITYLDRSRRLGQNQHGTIGINRAVQTIKDLRLRKIFQTMLMRHELAHALTGRHDDEFEAEQSRRDQMYLANQCSAAGISGGDFIQALKEASKSIDGEEFLFDIVTNPIASDNVPQNPRGRAIVLSPKDADTLMARILSNDDPQPPTDPAATYRTRGEFFTQQIVMSVDNQNEIVHFTSEADVTRFMERLGPKEVYTMDIAIPRPAKPPLQIAVTISRMLHLDQDLLQDLVQGLIERLAINNFDRIPRRLNIVIAQSSEYLVDYRFARYGFLAINRGALRIADNEVRQIMTSTLFANALSSALTGRSGQAFREAQVIRDARFAMVNSVTMGIERARWYEALENHPAFDIGTLLDEMNNEVEIHNAGETARLIAQPNNGHAENIVDAVKITLPSQKKYNLFIIGHTHLAPQLLAYFTEYLFADAHLKDLSPDSKAQRLYRARLENFHQAIGGLIVNYREDIATIREIARHHSLIAVSIEASPEELAYLRDNAKAELEKLTKLVQASGIFDPEKVVDDLFLALRGPEVYMCLTDQDHNAVIKALLSSEDEDLKRQNILLLQTISKLDGLLAQEVAAHNEDPARIKQIIETAEDDNLDAAAIDRLLIGMHKHIKPYVHALAEIQHKIDAVVSERSAAMASNILAHAEENTDPGDTFIIVNGRSHNSQFLDTLNALAAEGKLAKVETMPDPYGGSRTSPTPSLVTTTHTVLGTRETPGGVNFDAEKVNLEVQTQSSKNDMANTQTPFDLKEFEGFTFREISLTSGAEI